MNERSRGNLHGYPASVHIQSHAPAIHLLHTRNEIKCYELLSGKMAKIVHKRPHQECEPTYEKLFAWIEESGRRLVGPTREVYLNGPQEVPPEELLTEVYTPIE